MENIPDFSNRRSFPGTDGNPFDLVLRKLEIVEKIPSLLFMIVLYALALVPTFFRWPSEPWWTFGLWLFLLGDWALIAQLTRAGKSFGPSHTPTLLLALLRLPFALLPLPLALFFEAAGTLLVVYAFWIEPHTIRVTGQKLRTPKLKRGAPIRILHLGDLHIERITGRERMLNRLVKELKPDLILFTGDILNLSYLEDPTAQEQARQIMGEWQADCGVYAVTGSPAVDRQDTFGEIVDGLPLHWLRGEEKTVEVKGQNIHLLGLTCTHKPFEDAPQLEKLTAEGGGGFTILLYHSPDLAPNAAQTGKVDLQLSGHTHGGQVRLPLVGALFAGSLYGKRFEAGRYQVGPMTLYVTRGIGMEGKAAPRVRFLCPPEVILWEIEGTG